MTDSKDWTGNKASVYKTLAASNYSNSEREKNDFYATDPKAIDLLLEKENFSDLIWEPACGQGHLSKRLEQNGYEVLSTDLIDRGFGIAGVNFLNQGSAPKKHYKDEDVYIFNVSGDCDEVDGYVENGLKAREALKKIRG